MECLLSFLRRHFARKTSGCVAKCRLFSHTTIVIAAVNSLKHLLGSLQLWLLFLDSETMVILKNYTHVLLHRSQGTVPRRAISTNPMKKFFNPRLRSLRGSLLEVLKINFGSNLRKVHLHPSLYFHCLFGCFLQTSGQRLVRKL